MKADGQGAQLSRALPGAYAGTLGLGRSVSGARVSRPSSASTPSRMVQFSLKQRTVSMSG